MQHVEQFGLRGELVLWKPVEDLREFDRVTRAVDRDRGVVDGCTELLARRWILNTGLVESGRKRGDAELDDIRIGLIVRGCPRCHCVSVSLYS